MGLYIHAYAHTRTLSLSHTHTDIHTPFPARITYYTRIYRSCRSAKEAWSILLFLYTSSILLGFSGKSPEHAGLFARKRSLIWGSCRIHTHPHLLTHTHAHALTPRHCSSPSFCRTKGFRCTWLPSVCLQHTPTHLGQDRLARTGQESRGEDSKVVYQVFRRF